MPLFFANNGPVTAGTGTLRQWQVYRSTTDATVTTLTTDGAAPSASNTIAFGNNLVVAYQAIVSCRQTGGSSGATGEGAVWEFSGGLWRGAALANTTLSNNQVVARSIYTAQTGTAGNAAMTPMVGFNTSSGNIATNGSSSDVLRITVTADTTNGALQIAFTGGTNRNFNVGARVISLEFA